ncbi:MAG: DNA primase, partial [Eubacteriales bacterium]|nr:DNA primase [Eubacteriales bacterium]
MRYSDEIIEEIRLGNDIVDIINGYTALKQKGNSFFGLCPFHKESTPSFSVSPDKQLYHCFGCGASGTVFNFIMNIENYDFLDTIRYLADKINYQLPELTYTGAKSSSEIELKNKLYDIHKIVARKYYENLSMAQGDIANKYLDERKVLPNIRKKYGLGYSLFKKDDIYNLLIQKGYTESEILASGLVLKDKKGRFYDRFFGRLMFPIIDVQGRIIGFGGRELNGQKNTAKYLNSPDTPIFNKSYNLYSINFARYSKTKEFILVEGYMDVIALYQIGVTNVVASLGTAFNENHARALKKYANKAILLFDSDDAGTNAILRAIPVLTQNGINVKVLQVSNAKDPDEYIKKFGAENFIKLLNNAKSHILFEIEQKLKEYNIEDITEKIEFTKEVAKIISKLENNIEKEVFAKEASNITGISFDTIYTEIKNFSESSSINFKKIKYNKSKHDMAINKIEEAKKGLLY